MRPTDLHFRSPREKTAEFLYPVLTSDGRNISLNKGIRVKGSFSTSRRFPQYDEHAKKTGYRVGPGAYNLNQSSIGKSIIKGTPIYHKNHGGKNLSNNGYIFVGNSVLFDPGLMNKNTAVVDNTECKVDATQVLNFSSENKNRKSLQETTDSFKRVPWYVKVNETQYESINKDILSDSFLSNKKKSKREKFYAKALKTSPKFE